MLLKHPIPVEAPAHKPIDTSGSGPSCGRFALLSITLAVAQIVFVTGSTRAVMVICVCTCVRVVLWWCSGRACRDFSDVIVGNSFGFYS